MVRTEGYKTEVFPSEGWPPEDDPVCRPLIGKPLPLVDELQITVLRELLPGWIMGRQGYTDRIAVQKAAAAAAITSSSELAPKYANRGMKLKRAQTPSTFYQSINMQDPLLGSNKKLRQALSCAYDPQGFIDMLYGGVAPVAQQLLPPGVYGFQKDFRNPYGHNLEKARRLLAEAGYPGGRDPKTGAPLEITMDVSATGGEERQLYEYEQNQFQQLGIRMRLIENTFARLLEKQDQGNFQIAAGSGWSADYPDAENFYGLFVKSNWPPGGKNISRYHNPEFEKLFAQMAEMENSPERLAIVKQMNEILTEDCPIILNFNKAFYIVVQPWAPLTHLNMMLPGDIYAGLRYLPIDPVAREKARREWNPVPKWPIGVAAGLLGLGLVAAVRINRRRVV
jgi:oligopeptide transport system substrate-binding protein